MPAARFEYIRCALFDRQALSALPTTDCISIEALPASSRAWTLLLFLSIFFSPQRRQVHREKFSFYLPPRGRQIKNNLPSAKKVKGKYE
jgi:hypothetical protein